MLTLIISVLYNTLMQLRKPFIALNTFILSSFLAAQPVGAQTKSWSGVCVAS